MAWGYFSVIKNRVKEKNNNLHTKAAVLWRNQKCLHKYVELENV